MTGAAIDLRSARWTANEAVYPSGEERNNMYAERESPVNGNLHDEGGEESRFSDEGGNPGAAPLSFGQPHRCLDKPPLRMHKIGMHAISTASPLSSLVSSTPVNATRAGLILLQQLSSLSRFHLFFAEQLPTPCCALGTVPAI